MASVDETVHECIMNYPGLFENRSSVLDFLFFVIGNGYEWHNGELVTDYPEDRGWQPPILRHAHMYEDYWGRDDEFGVEMAWRTLEHLAEDEDREVLIRDQVWVREKFWGAPQSQLDSRWPLTLNTIATHPDGWNFYPMSEYARSEMMPDNVKPDWKLAVEQTVARRKFYEARPPAGWVEAIEEARVRSAEQRQRLDEKERKRHEKLDKIVEKILNTLRESHDDTD